MLYCTYVLQDKSDGSVSRLKEFLQIPVVPSVKLQKNGEQVDIIILISKNQALQLLYLKHHVYYY